MAVRSVFGIFENIDWANNNDSDNDRANKSEGSEISNYRRLSRWLRENEKSNLHKCFKVFKSFSKIE